MMSYTLPRMKENKKIYPNLTDYNLAEAVCKVWRKKGRKLGAFNVCNNLRL